MKIFEVNNLTPRQSVGPQANIVIFDHIPKAAGGFMFGLFAPNISESPSDIQNWHKTPYYNVSHGMPNKEICPATNTLVWAHGLYGLHEYVDLTATYATVIRDPIERFISEYFWMAANSRTHQSISHRQVYESFVIDVDSLDNANFQTFHFSEPGRQWPAQKWTHILGFDGYRAVFDHELMSKFPIATAYEKAMANLKTHFTFVGISELAIESIFMMADLYGWKNLVHASNPNLRVNHAQQRPTIVELPIKTRRKLERITEADRAIYDEYRHKFELAFEESDYGPALMEMKSYLVGSELSATQYFQDAVAFFNKQVRDEMSGSIATVVRSMRLKEKENDALKNLALAQKEKIEQLENKLNQLVIEKITREMLLVAN